MSIFLLGSTVTPSGLNDDLLGQGLEVRLASSGAPVGRIPKHLLRSHICNPVNSFKKKGNFRITLKGDAKDQATNMIEGKLKNREARSAVSIPKNASLDNANLTILFTGKSSREDFI